MSELGNDSGEESVAYFSGGYGGDHPPGYVLRVPITCEINIYKSFNLYPLTFCNENKYHDGFYFL